MNPYKKKKNSLSHLVNTNSKH